jgi:hypothetical protein
MVGDDAALVVYERAGAGLEQGKLHAPDMKAEPAGCNIRLRVSRFAVSCRKLRSRQQRAREQ